jgi:Rv2175c C-terminal domain of unknown function
VNAQRGGHAASEDAERPVVRFRGLSWYTGDRAGSRGAANSWPACREPRRDPPHRTSTRSCRNGEHRTPWDKTLAAPEPFWESGVAAWQAVGVTDTPKEPASWLALPDVAERLDMPVNRVRQLVREGKFLALRREGVLQMPAELVDSPIALKHLPGVLTLLHDAGYNDEEAFQWLYTPDESLPGVPAEALGDTRATEVKRRAQALGF